MKTNFLILFVNDIKFMDKAEKTYKSVSLKMNALSDSDYFVALENSNFYNRTLQVSIPSSWTFGTKTESGYFVALEMSDIL